MVTPLYRCDTFFNNKKSDTNSVVYDSPVELSVVGMRPYISEDVEMSLVKMLFLDCLACNCDRHGGNFSFYVNPYKVMSGLVGLYDHGLSLWNSRRDVSLFPFSGYFEVMFDDLFKQLLENYEGFILEIISRVASQEFVDLLEDLECYDFVWERVLRFKSIVGDPGSMNGKSSKLKRIR